MAECSKLRTIYMAFYHGFVSRQRCFGNGLYHAGSDTDAITTTAMSALHPIHTVTVLALLLVSSSAICPACMQLVRTLSYPVFSTVSGIVNC
jgi:hypothetical protein